MAMVSSVDREYLTNLEKETLGAAEEIGDALKDRWIPSKKQLNCSLPDQAALRAELLSQLPRKIQILYEEMVKEQECLRHFFPCRDKRPLIHTVSGIETWFIKLEKPLAVVTICNGGETLGKKRLLENQTIFQDAFSAFKEKRDSALKKAQRWGALFEDGAPEEMLSYARQCFTAESRVRFYARAINITQTALDCLFGIAAIQEKIFLSHKRKEVPKIIESYLSDIKTDEKVLSTFSNDKEIFRKVWSSKRTFQLCATSPDPLLCYSTLEKVKTNLPDLLSLLLKYNWSIMLQAFEDRGLQDERVVFSNPNIPELVWRDITSQLDVGPIAESLFNLSKIVTEKVRLYEMFAQYLIEEHKKPHSSSDIKVFRECLSKEVAFMADEKKKLKEKYAATRATDTEGVTTMGLTFVTQAYLCNTVYMLWGCLERMQADKGSA